jgi:hypothetical protein
LFNLQFVNAWLNLYSGKYKTLYDYDRTYTII